MFGFAPYAATPYASVGGSKYAVSVTEEASIREAISGFLQQDSYLLEFGEVAGSVYAGEDAVGKAADNAQASDRTASIIVGGAAFSDGAMIGDNIDGPRSFFRIFSEVVQAHDAFNFNGRLRASFRDTAAVTARTSANYGASVSWASSARASETASSLPTYSTDIAEAVSGSVLIDTSAIYRAVFSSNAEASVVVPTNADLHIGVVDAATAKDYWPTNVHVYSYVTEGVRIKDADFIGRFLWELIDDTQAPNWQNITNSQNPGWAMLDTAQGVVWQQIATTQTPGWGTIETDQTAEWHLINNI